MATILSHPALRTKYSLLQAHPIHKLEYPAITICGQGMATDTLDKVLKQRFEVWLRKRNIDVDCRLPVLIEGHNKLSTPQRSVKISWLPWRKTTRRSRSPAWRSLWRTSPPWWQPPTPALQSEPRLSVRPRPGRCPNCEVAVPGDGPAPPPSLGCQTPSVINWWRKRWISGRPNSPVRNRDQYCWSSTRGRRWTTSSESSLTSTWRLLRWRTSGWVWRRREKEIHLSFNTIQSTPPPCLACPLIWQKKPPVKNVQFSSE